MSKLTDRKKRRTKTIKETVTPEGKEYLRPRNKAYKETYSVEKTKPRTTKSFKRTTTVSKPKKRKALLGTYMGPDVKTTYTSKKVKQKKKGTKTVERRGVWDNTKKKPGNYRAMSNITKGRKVTKNYKARKKK